MLKNDLALRKAEVLLAEVASQVQSGNTLEEAQWSAFKPQANLSPILLDTGADHLEVMGFSEAIETYIVMGFRGQVPKSGVWKYIAPFLSSSWWASMKLSRWKSRGDYSSIE